MVAMDAVRAQARLMAKREGQGELMTELRADVKREPCAEVAMTEGFESTMTETLKAVRLW